MAMVKAPTKIHRNVCNYKKADFAGLRHALNAVNLSLQLVNDNIDDVWQTIQAVYFKPLSLERSEI